VLLHSNATFDEEKYRSLIEKISTYADLLGDSRRMNRAVASCLFELMTAIQTAASTFSQIDHPDTPRVAEAFNEVTGLLHLKVFRF
jgi:hypothetical protein